MVIFYKRMDISVPGVIFIEIITPPPPPPPPKVFKSILLSRRQIRIFMTKGLEVTPGFFKFVSCFAQYFESGGFSRRRDRRGGRKTQVFRNFVRNLTKFSKATPIPQVKITYFSLRKRLVSQTLTPSTTPYNAQKWLFSSW